MKVNNQTIQILKQWKDFSCWFMAKKTITETTNHPTPQKKKKKKICSIIFLGTTSGKWDIKNYVPVISLPFEPKRAWSIPGSRQSLGGVGGNSVTYSYWFQFCLSCFWSTLSLLTAHIKCIFFNPTNILFLNATLCQQLWNTLITKFYHHVYKIK